MALIYWTFADARRRIADPLLIGCSVALGVPLRGDARVHDPAPARYLEDVRERELEMQAAEARLHAADYHLPCPHCDYHIERDFLRCPNCLCSKLKDRCVNLRASARAERWTLCPYCETPVVGALATGARRREAYAGDDAARGACDARASPHDTRRPPRWSARSSSPSPTPTPAA